MKKHRITFIRGDGVGPELATVTAEVLEATGASIEWDWQDAGIHALEKLGAVVPEVTVTSIRSNGVAIKSPISTPVGEGYRSPNVFLRQTFECFANVRPAKLLPGVASRFESVDLVVIRENMEDLYAGIEFEHGKAETKELSEFITRTTGHQLSSSTGISIKPISVERSQAIARFAFEYARTNKRKRITIVHKANIMKHTDGLFLATCREIAAKFPDIVCDDEIVDALSMHLIRDPSRYDILLCPNLYGDILSDMTAQIAGGIGIAPAANIGRDVAIFEAVHGSVPKLTGKDKVNPIALIRAGGMMLTYLGERNAADKLERALQTVLLDGQHVTYDLRKDGDARPAVGTRDAARAVINALQSV